MITILLKILILLYLYQVLDDHRCGPVLRPRSYPLAYTLGQGRNRLDERITDHDVYPYFAGINDYPSHLLSRTVGCGLGVAPGAQRVNPTYGEDRFGYAPRQLQVVS